MAATTLSQVYPLGSCLNEAGRLEVGGCDVVELAKEFGTPAYVYAEDDMRARARSFQEAFGARTEHFEVIYASKAFPCTAAYRLFAEEGLSCDVASAGELHLALAGGFDPARIYMHGNNKTEEELAYGVERGVGTIVLDSFDEIERVKRLAPGQQVMLRVTPGIKPSTHSYVQTGQVDSKFGFALDDVPRALGQLGDLELTGLHAHIGSQIFELEPFEKVAEVLGALGDWPRLNLGGGLGIAYTVDDDPPSIEDFADALLRRAPKDVTVLCEPGRALVGNAGVTIYTVGTVKEIPGIRTYVAVDGGMSDNLRPMLYGARYEAMICHPEGGGGGEAAGEGGGAPPGESLCTVAGMHCESSDILVRDVMLDDPKPGDVLVIPATGAYGHAMANNYNSLRRPPVIFCKDGDARVVVRRETFDDLTARDVL
jgi:diaminopimelate decarboxylase